MKNERQVERNDEIVRRRNTGETFSSIGKDLGVTAKRAANVWYREQARAAQVPKQLSKRTLQRHRAQGIEPAVVQPSYHASAIRQMVGAALKPYTMPASLRLACARAAAFQPRLLSCASKVIEGVGHDR